MSHEHRFFLFQVKADFEPDKELVPGSVVWKRVEYAILSCNCGEVVKTKVKARDDD